MHQTPKKISYENLQPCLGRMFLDVLERGKRGRADNLLDFTLATFREYQVNWHHELLCQKLDAWERGEIKRLMLFLPPRHGRMPIKLLFRRQSMKKYLSVLRKPVSRKNEDQQIVLIFSLSFPLIVFFFSFSFLPI